MTKHTAAFLLLTFGLVPAASAAPIQLNSAQFTAAIAGLTTITEDFEGFTAGSKTEPFTFANGTVSGFPVADSVVSDIPEFCLDAGDQCLTRAIIDGVRTISALPAGTTLWAVTDFFALSSTDIFRIIVTGNSGTTTFELPGASFYGFSDPTGLISVSFINLFGGFVEGNYSLDDIVTAGPAAPVPEPATISLLVLGLAGIGVQRWRRRKA